MSGELNPKGINTTALAFLGDAVYETYIREHVLREGRQNADLLHKTAVRYVCAEAQAKAVKSLMGDFLTEEEADIVRRARNRKTESRSRHTDSVTYKLATAFEALIGYLELSGDKEREAEIIGEAIARIEERQGK